ncbi:MAG: LysM peptidoglycan-binding domain-containing protein [Gammaproteobacteria bacterium]|nr:LysM peptidoglycan-binding domain-containing protein [Gammaproteobacteria bacterium]NIR96982.1 LysM peptidoglycan-binding domain-containing protein [Gammaproteobacteria bacterium]NIT62684.1 LysM peptidoglycan-binding domain-containing protein [Gammaproteobacteria bacterium]NIV19644.1 LysM peptidoglycan-binding domain-containing protein [Gammaproteobacteria bacterium]NIX10864.1 LysM peptidoglycan-binding domain-containing protein [Gammaproteobacteria bacterium]
MRLLSVVFIAFFAIAGCDTLPHRVQTPTGPQVPDTGVAAKSPAFTGAASAPGEDEPLITAGTAELQRQFAPILGPAPEPVRNGSGEAQLAGPAGPAASTEAEPQAPASNSSPGSQAPPDLWARIRQGFQLSGHGHARVQKYQRWYADHPGYIDRMTDRAEPFLHMIVEEVERRGMPTEVALLPVVESAFQPFAYSHGRAAGIWQFIPGTGRRYGLKQNWWYDGRRDVAASTRAALDYLEKLHGQFDGDWLLALAAYNSGEGTVERAIARNRRRGVTTDFWYLDLPRETEGYPPKLLAISAIVEDPAAHGIALKPITDAPKVAKVDVGSQIDLALLADLADMKIEEVYRLNPGFNRWATDPDGPHTLLVPVNKSETLSNRLAELPADQRVRWQRYKIRRGDSLIRIARRHRTTVGMLRKVNRLRGNRIITGRHLLIPVAARSPSSYRLSADQRRRALRGRGPAGRDKVVHKVRRGDTLWGISRRYGVSVRRLARWNGMAPKDYLRPGQKLVIWVKPQPERSAGLSHVNASLPISAMIQPLRYIVRRGDSLSRIARRFRVTVNDLRKWNGLQKGRYLQPGQRLTLYVDVTRQAGS